MYGAAMSYFSQGPRPQVWRRIPCVIVLILLTAGCAQLCPLGIGCEATAEIRVKGTPDMNAGQAATVALFQLSGEASFRRTPLEQFWRDEVGDFNGEVVERQPDLLLFPGETRQVRFPLRDDTRFVGIAANLRDPRTDAWKFLMPVRDLRDGQALVRIGANDLTVALP